MYACSINVDETEKLPCCLILKRSKDIYWPFYIVTPTVLSRERACARALYLCIYIYIHMFRSVCSRGVVHVSACVTAGEQQPTLRILLYAYIRIDRKWCFVLQVRGGVRENEKKRQKTWCATAHRHRCALNKSVPCHITSTKYAAILI